MSYLSLVYGGGVVLSSAAAVGAAYLGNMLNPVSTPTPLPDVKEKIDPESEILSKFPDKEQGKLVLEFLKTPVKKWEQIAKTPFELLKKYQKSQTHPNQNKCPPDLLEICKLVSVKFSNIRNFIRQDQYEPLGDQTEEAFQILRGNR